MNVSLHRVLSPIFARPVAHRRTIFSLLCTTILLSCAYTAHAQQEMFNFLAYSHSYFNTKNWKLTKDTTAFNISDDLLANAIGQGVTAGQRDTNIALFSTTDGSTYFSRITALPPTIPFNEKWLISASDAIRCTVATNSQLFTLFAPFTGSVDTVFVAWSDTTSADTIFTCRIKTQNFTILDRDTIVLAPVAPTARILCLQAAPKHAGDNVTGLWICGTNGLIRYYNWSGSGWNGATSYDIAATMDITALHPLVLGTATGQIYSRVNETFTLATQPGTTAIRQITPAGACGDQGTVIRKTGTVWKLFTKGTANYRRANFTPYTSGAGVELLDATWQYSSFFLENTATSFTLTPDSLNNNKFFNGTVWQLTAIKAKPETLSVILHDPDANYFIPTISLASLITETRFLTTDAAGRTLNAINPDSLPSPGAIELADSTLSLVFSLTSVTLRAKARIGRFNPSRGFYWKDTLFVSSYSWNYRDDCSIVMGSRTFRAQNLDTPPVITAASPTMMETPRIAIAANPVSRSIDFSFSVKYLSAIQIYDLQGRQLADVVVSPTTSSLTIPLHTAPGIVCVETRLTNGTREHRTVTLMR
jgi:hypothetical protein